VRCPTCNADFDIKASAAPPFCSERCRQIDLGRWLGEKHSVPHVPGSDDEDPDDVAAPHDRRDREHD